MANLVNSIIFHTQNLAANKSFYQKVFGFEIGTYQKNGSTLPDESETYVNFHVNELLLCFETGSHTDKATLVLHVANLTDFKTRAADQGIEILKQTDFFLKIKDPDGRSLIVEQQQ